VIEVDRMGKIRLSRKVLLPVPEGFVPQERAPRPERRDRGDRGDRGPRGGGRPHGGYR